VIATALPFCSFLNSTQSKTRYDQQS